MKQFFYSIIFILLMTTIGFAEQTLLESGQTWGITRGVINANDTELYTFKDAYATRIFEDNPANYIILDEQFTDLSAWITSGTTSVSGGVVTLTDNNSYIAISLTNLKQTYSLPINEPYIIEFTASAASGQQFFLKLFRSTKSMIENLIYANSICSESEDNVGGFKCDTPTNFDMTSKFKIRLLIDPVVEVMQVYMYYENSSTNSPEIRETVYTGTLPFDADDSEQLTAISLSNGDAVGVSTVENFRIYKPWLIGIGDSLMVGQPYNWAGIPSLTNNEGCSILKWIEKSVGDQAIAVNQGLGGYTTALTASRIDSMVAELKPEWCLISIGSNDIILDVPIATMKTNLATIVDTCTAAGIKVVINEVIPRDVFTDAQDLVKEEWNLWLRTFVATRSMCVLSESHDLLADPNNSDNMRPMYKADTDGHTNALGTKIIANAMYQVMNNYTGI